MAAANLESLNFSDEEDMEGDFIKYMCTAHIKYLSDSRVAHNMHINDMRAQQKQASLDLQHAINRHEATTRTVIFVRISF